MVLSRFEESRKKGWEGGASAIFSAVERSLMMCRFEEGGVSASNNEVTAAALQAASSTMCLMKVRDVGRRSSGETRSMHSSGVIVAGVFSSLISVVVIDPPCLSMVFCRWVGG